MRMKNLKKVSFIFLILIVTLICGGCNNSQNAKEENINPQNAISQPENTTDEKEEKVHINIEIKGKDYEAVLFKNETTTELIKKMPLTLKMQDLNANEKFYFFSEALPASLPGNSENPKQIKSGDIMLYEADCLVIFYESFSSPYSYTRLGYIENAYKLKDTLGSGNIKVKFTLKK